ncbi:putative ribonuclease H-like domain-containing protein [Tanacetum coccineum]
MNLRRSLKHLKIKVGKKAIGTKWVYRNKKDERGILVRNKARLVAQGHRQEEGIDYDEVFTLMARIEAIRIFLAFASYTRFIVYQIDVKSVFLYGKIDEEVYVSQPPAPRAWYATLSTFLLKNGYRRGTIDKTLFIKKDKHDIILVQVYVDDIIFGSTKKSWCDEFEALMKSRFQMSSMGELTFFLGLQVKQKADGIFISQDKYVAEILKKFDFVNVKTASTPIETQKPLVKDEEASDVDVHLYRSMIGSLMYLTASRPDIMFAVCACSRFQVTPKTSHLSAVKRIFRYLKGKPKLGLWYPRVSSFDLEAYSDSDYAGANLDRKSTTGGCQFLGRRLISWQCKKQTIVATSTLIANEMICDKKNKVLFTDSKCLVLSPEFKLPDENQVLLRIPRQNNMYSFNLENIVPSGGKFDKKSDEGFLVGYSLQSKAFRVYNLETMRVEENLHITFLENKPNITGKGPTWLFNLDYLTDLMNYQPARLENQANKHASPQEANHNAGTKDNIDVGDSEKEDEFAQDYFVLPIWSSYSTTVKRSTEKDVDEAPNKHPDLKIDEKPVYKENQVFLDEHERLKRQEKDAINAAETLRKEFAQETKDLLLQAGAAKASSTNTVNTISTPVSTASSYDGLSFPDPTNPDQDDSEIPAL